MSENLIVYSASNQSLSADVRVTLPLDGANEMKILDHEYKPDPALVPEILRRTVRKLEDALPDLFDELLEPTIVEVVHDSFERRSHEAHQADAGSPVHGV